MVKSYFKIAWRNLMKNKVFSFINILGLTIGITVSMMIFLFIMNEFSVDKFHTKGDRIYRVMRSFDASKLLVPWLSGPYAPALLNDFPGEITKAVRVSPSGGLITFDNKSFNEKKVYETDADFFSLFSFPLIVGDPATVLTDPASIVLTESTAKRYFGSVQNAMGKIVQFNKHLPLKVTGIAKDVPSNSHMSFDVVFPLSNFFHDDNFNVWINNGMFTYVLLNPQTSKEKVEKRFPQFVDKYMGKDMARFGFHFDLELTPLKNIYFESFASFDNARHGEKKVVYIFFSVAVLILIIACINFMNLSTIRAVERSKEVGIRKVMGAIRNSLVWQFIGESLMLTIIACCLSIGLLQVLMPFYTHLLGYSLSVSLISWPIGLFLLCVILLVGFFAGSYPAFFLSSFTPIQALKGKLILGKGGSLFRQSLVVVQFSISVLLIIGTIIIMNQMKYMKSKQLGYNKEQVLLIPLNNDDIYNNKASFKDGLHSNNGITSVSLMSGEPGGFFDGQMFDVEGHFAKQQLRTEFADFEFVKTLGLKVISGRDFSPQYATDTAEAVLINRTAATTLGFTPEQSIGKWIKNTVRDSTKRKIVGVVEDFNFLSLKENIEPLVISPSEDRRVAVVKIKPGNIQSALATIKEEYSKAAPLYPFEYTFLDQKFDETYKTDIRQQNILGIFSGLAIFIACMGLFGLASFAATRRTKEIGIRKVVGSSTQNIVLLLSKDLLKPVLLSSLIAIPLGYYVMRNWLQSFAFKTTMHWWIFVLAALIVITIAFFSISLKALKAAVANPIKSLRTE